MWRTLAIQTGLASMVEGAFQLLGGHNIAIVEIGTVELVEAVVDINGNVTTPPVLAAGFHVNLVHPDPPQALDPYLVIVNTPSMIFFGQVGSVPSNAVIAAIEADATVQGSPYTRAAKANNQNKKKLKDEVAILRGKRNKDNGGKDNGGNGGGGNGGGNSKIKSMAKGRRN